MLFTLQISALGHENIVTFGKGFDSKDAVETFLAQGISNSADRNTSANV